MEFEKRTVQKDLVVIGGGMPGLCAAIQAARLGLSVALVNDRGYLGGNASAEIRVSVDGADGCQEFNLFSRETGVLEEVRLEDLRRNPQNNKYIWDGVLLDMVDREKNIELFLNTNIDRVDMDGEKRIRSVSGSQMDSETRFDFSGSFFLDDTGDGTVGALAGAEFRMGREAAREFDERIAPVEADEKVLPSTLSFYARDMGEPVKYIPPDFAVDLTKTDILKYRVIPQNSFMRFQWYYEICGGMNQVKDIEKIIRMHRELVYGIWDYIKNSGNYPAENYDLEYVASLPGKRESRRIVGDYLLTEKDIVEQREFEDGVGYGGWSIDLHAVEGFYAREIINKHFFLKGIYQIPYRCGYSKNVENLFMAGRCMSTSHVAFGSTRVMATLSTLGQALGAAAHLCKKYDETPRGIYEKHRKELRQLLLKHDGPLVGVKNEDSEDLARTAKIEVSSVRRCEIEEGTHELVLEKDLGLSFPASGHVEGVSLLVSSDKPVTLRYKVYKASKKENYYPEELLLDNSLDLAPNGEKNSFQWVRLPLALTFDSEYALLQIHADSSIRVRMANEPLTGVTALLLSQNNAPNVVDIDTLEQKPFTWNKIEELPCFKLLPGNPGVYGGENINNGYARPYGQPNLWISDRRAEGEWVKVLLKERQPLKRLQIRFDSDLNTRLSFHNKTFNFMSRLVRDYDVYGKKGEEYTLLKEVRGNYQRVNEISLEGVEADGLKIVFHATHGAPCVGIYEIRVY